MRLILMLLLAALPLMSGVAQVETPDECAARLDDEIEVRSIAEATNWYEQVMRECVEAEGEGILRLAIDLHVTLPNTGCEAGYTEHSWSGDGSFQLRSALWLGSTNSIKLHWRHGSDGEWEALERGEILNETYIFYVRESGYSPREAGLHQFELRPREGADKFEIMETWSALYILLIIC